MAEVWSSIITLVQNDYVYVCRCRLVIERVNYSHAGVYTCQASNRVSVLESNMTLVVSGKPAL